jgi:hypothetical protein
VLTILPAGGRAERFDGIYKELLPIGEGDFLLSAAIRRASALGADRALVISNADKVTTHAKFLARHASGFSVELSVRSECDEHLWAALRRAIPSHEAGLLLLPDTTWRCTSRIPEGADLAFGVFDTDEPHRFSLVHEGRILTKPRDVVGRWSAWGCVYWSANVAAFWEREQKLHGVYPEYDRAFEAAMREFGYSTFAIDDYHDLGTWAAYASYLRAA